MSQIAAHSLQAGPPGDVSGGPGVLQGDASRDLAEQLVELAGTVVEDLQRVIPLDPDAEHGHREQVLGCERAGDLRPVPASADPLEVRSGVARPARATGGKVAPHQAGGEVLIAEPDRSEHEFGWDRSA